MRLILGELTEPYRTMVLIAACLGLRASEIIGLQWGDLNWEDRTLLVRRSVVQGRVGDTKTEASRLPLPLDSNLADVLRAHRQRSLHAEPATGYLRTARGSRAGRRAFCDGRSNRQRCVPALARLAGTRFGILIRACYVESVLTSKSNKNCCGTDTIQSTMNVYTQAMSEGKRAASVIVRSVLPRERCGDVSA